MVRPGKVGAVLRGLLAAVLGVGGHNDGEHARHILVARGDALGDDAVEELAGHARLTRAHWGLEDAGLIGHAIGEGHLDGVDVGARALCGRLTSGGGGGGALAGLGHFFRSVDFFCWA